MHRIFVDKRRDLSEKELFELNTFCSLLPGASSTQLLILIAHRKGGVPLSIITLILWILPATILMGSLAIMLTKVTSHKDPLQVFRYLQPMVVGFIIYSAYRSFLQIKHNKKFVGIALFLSMVCLSFYKAPLIVPIILLTGGLIAWYTTRRKISTNTIHRPTVRWFHLTLFFLIFLISGSLSELSKKYKWSERSYFNLFENCYRFGSIVFGGGDVMIPMMYEQYVARPTSQRIKTRNQQVLKIDKDLFLSGAGVVRTIPGPVFSFSAFIGGSAMSGRGTLHQIGGIITATLAVFLPSLFLVIFFYPLWEFIQSNESLMPIFKGIQASTVSFMIASALYLSKDALLFHSDHVISIQPINALGVFMTLLLLLFRVLSPLFITILFFSLGIIF